MPEKYDFVGLAARLLADAESLLPQWLPGGRREGREWVCGDLSGRKGKTLKINLDKGIWRDFASGDGGGDLIDLYAILHGQKLGEAYRELSAGVGFTAASDWVAPPPAPEPKPETGPPPSEDMLRFGFSSQRYGKPTKIWVHRDEGGRALMVAARYDYDDEGTPSKAVLPWTWHLREARWVMRGLGYPSRAVLQPLYGTEKLPRAPGAQVLLVEGAKKADAAQRIVGDALVVLSWPGGCQAVRRVDWSPLAGRSVVGWPDADLKRLGEGGGLKPYAEQPGPAAMQAIGGLLQGVVKAFKIVDVGLDESRADGWDLADAEAEGWDQSRLLAFARERARPWAALQAPLSAPVPPEMPEPEVQPETVMEALTPEILEARAPDPDDGESAQLPASVYSEWERLNIATAKNGNPHNNVDNVGRFLTNETALKNYLWYDEFHCKIFTQFDLRTFRTLPAPREWTETDEISLLTYIQRHVGLVKMGLDTVCHAVKLYASEHVRNEPLDWLKTLVWDGVPRIEDFLTTAFGVEKSEYVAAASRNWVTSLAARIMHPGIKVDTMLILRGPQGLKKSTALEALGAPWFAELHQSVETKDFYIALQGKLLVEISELSAFTKSGAEAIKKMLSTKDDDYRPVFGKYNKKHPRHTVFAGSTNETFFLNDPTGARRFWPITCMKIDVPYIRANRAQLFAEAAARVREWERTQADCDGWWEMPGEGTRDAQELHRQYDEWENNIAGWLQEPLDFDGGLAKDVTIGAVAKGALSIEPGKIDRFVQTRVGKILAVLGWESKSVWRDSRTQRVWVRPDPETKK